MRTGPMVRRCDAVGGSARRVSWALLVALVLGVGCGGGGEEESDEVAARGAPPENHATTISPTLPHPSTAAVTDSSPCPATGRWAECSVLKRLEQAGLVPDTSHGSATEPPLTAKGIHLTVRRAELELYFYPDKAARERDQRRLDRSRYLEAEQPPEPRHKPTIVTSENLLVVLDTRNERQRERITLAITAGPPQPPAP